MSIVQSLLFHQLLLCGIDFSLCCGFQTLYGALKRGKGGRDLPLKGDEPCTVGEFFAVETREIAFKLLNKFAGFGEVDFHGEGLKEEERRKIVREKRKRKGKKRKRKRKERKEKEKEGKGEERK